MRSLRFSVMNLWRSSNLEVLGKRADENWARMLVLSLSIKGRELTSF